MGCHLSRRGDSDSNPRIFKVYNVDDQWTELSSGKIEITDTNLILYQRGKEPILWPLRSLRRYGFDAELFSFESGRRCPTGPGIYAFKCRRADALFNLLQESIQKAGQEEQQRTTIVDDSAGSRPGSLVVIHQQGDASPIPGQYVQPLTLAESQAAHAAAAAAAAATAPEAAERLPSPHHYVNGDVALGNGRSRSALFLPGHPLHEYVNTAVSLPITTSGLAAQRSTSVDSSLVRVELAPSNGARATERNNSEGQVITYAVLDLPPSKESVNNNNKDRAQSTPCHTAVAQNGNAVMIDLISSQATYVNVPASDSQSRSTAAAGATAFVYEHRGSLGSLSSRDKDDQHSYANLDLVTPVVLPNGQAPPPPPTKEPRKQKVNYIQLDLGGSSDNLSNGGMGLGGAGVPPASPISLTASIPESPSRRTESYATIDFHKTAALSNSAKSSNDEGFRKTRHNSNIEELN